MSDDLYLAAQQGDIQTVRLILNSPDFDPAILNTKRHMGDEKFKTLFHSNHLFTTPLGIALVNQHVEIAMLLIEKGSAVEKDYSDKTHQFDPGYLAYAFFHNYQNAVSLVAIHGPKDLDLFKLLLQKTSQFRNLHWNQYEHINLLMHELLLRNEKQLLDKFVSSRTDRIASYLNNKTMQAYLGSRHLNNVEWQQATDAIIYLKLTNQLDVEPANELLDLINVHHALEEDELAALKNSANRKFDELFAELQYWLYPEEKLSPFCLNQANSAQQTISYNTKSKSLEEMAEWQNPSCLREFLAQDEMSIIKRLCASLHGNHHSPAALLLHVILDNYADKNIVLDNLQESLLTKTQVEHGRKALNQFYSLPSLTKKLIYDSYQKDLLLSEQEATIAALKNSTEQHTQQLSTMMDRLNQLQLAVDTNKLSSNRGEQSETETAPSTMRLFGK